MFGQIQFIGYYSNSLIRIEKEKDKVEDAAEFASKLQQSLTRMQKASVVKKEILAELASSILLFKNRQRELFAFDPENKIARLTDVPFNHNMLQHIQDGYNFPYFVPGDAFIVPRLKGENTSKVKQIKVDLDVLRIDVEYDSCYYVVPYGGTLCRIKMLPYEVSLYRHDKEKKHLTCIYKGLNEYGEPVLFQDRATQIEELYESDTVHTFKYWCTRNGYSNNGEEFEYHVLKDNEGLHHNLYCELPEEQRTRGAKIQVYIKSINTKTGNLNLGIYDPTIERKIKEWYDANRVFGEIDEMENKEALLDKYLKKHTKLTELDKDLQIQYKEENNLWLFTYLNILDREIISGYIRKHQIEELDLACKTMIKLQKWMVEGSSFLDLFGDEKKEDTISKSTYEINKFQRISLAVDLVRNSNQDQYVEDIISAIESSGKIALNKEERLEVLNCILRIYPGYLLQDIERTCRLLKAILTLKETQNEHFITTITNLLNISIGNNIAEIRKSAFRTNDIDISQTVKLREVLSLLIALAIILTDERYKNELEARTAKARFFRYLSLLSPEEKQASVVKAGVDALVGVINDEHIFTWENAMQINVIHLVSLTLQAPVLDDNADNDFCFYKGKRSGAVLLDATGFTIVPYKQCIESFNPNSTPAYYIRPIHHLETLPVKIGSMYNLPELSLTDDAVEHLNIWHKLSKLSAAAMINLNPPQIGDKVRVVVKEQTQKDNLKYLLFVSVVDPNYKSVDGVILASEIISGKWIADVRNVFNEGDSFYAKVISINGDKYNFSIKQEINELSTSVNLQDDAKNIVLKSPVYTSPVLSKNFLQELVLLIDMRIRKELSPLNRYTLTGYAYCLCALISDPKSYYYDFMLRYYAFVEQFLSNSHQDVTIEFDDADDDKFPDMPAKRKFIELLKYASSGSEEGVATLQTLVSENDSSASRLAATILSLTYAQKAGFDKDVVAGIREEIRKRINASESFNLSTLDFKSENINQSESSDIAVADTEEESAFTESVENVDIIDVEADSAKSQCDEPIDSDLVFYADKTMSLIEHNSKCDSGDVVRIHLPITGDSYKVLVLTSDYKFHIVDTTNMNYDITEPTSIKSYAIKNYFVVLDDSVVGLSVSTKQGEYLILHDINNLEQDTLLSSGFTLSDIRHCQPFILPARYLSDEIKKLVGKKNNVEEVSEAIIADLQNYGIFIR